MKKLFTSMFLVLALLTMTAGTVFAQETTLITGAVQSVVLETDATTGATLVVVTLIDSTGTSQTVTIDLITAESLGLVTTDPATNITTVAVDAVGKTVEIDPATTINNNTEEETTAEHPVGSALSDFFSELLGVDYDTIMTFHEDGVGFGVIAQALWLTNNLDGDTTTFEALLEAKQSGDYSAITLADGSTPDNWGDVVKSLKKGDNLGSVMSGKAEDKSATSESTIAVPGNGHGNGNNANGGGNVTSGNGGGNGNAGGNGNGGNNGNGHGNGNGGNNGHGNGNGGGGHP